jgi:UDP-N-acetylglucosamine acyltransferase
MVNAHVGHNCIVGDNVTLVNGSMLGGFAQIGDRAIIGGNVAVHQFCRIGRLVMLSNACCMNVDVPPFFTSLTPNHLTQLNAVGLRRAGIPKENIDAIRRAFQLLFRSNRILGAAIEQLPSHLLQVPEVAEMVKFCKETKRGVARFKAWSSRGGEGAGATEE